MSRTRLVFAQCVLLLAGCDMFGGAPPEHIPTLDEVSGQVQFESVERLGSHHFLATVYREEERGGVVSSVSEETVEIKWQDWDHFEYRRLVNGRAKSEVRVVRGHAWVKKGSGKWSRKDDAERYRVQLRGTWSAWDNALESFLDRLLLTEQEGGLVEGRPVRSFAVGLTSEVVERLAAGENKVKVRDGMQRRAREGGPVKLSGSVSLDEATAVRLAADVKGVYRRGEVIKRVELKLTRGSIGEPQVIRKPTTSKKKSRVRSKKSDNRR